MKASNYNDVEVWVERRRSCHYLYPDPLTLNEAVHEQNPAPVLKPAGQWETVDERNPSMSEHEGRVIMIGGFEIEQEDKTTNDYRVCVKRGSDDEGARDLKVVLSSQDEEYGVLFMSSRSQEAVALILWLNEPIPQTARQIEAENMATDLVEILGEPTEEELADMTVREWDKDHDNMMAVLEAGNDQGEAYRGGDKRNLPPTKGATHSDEADKTADDSAKSLATSVVLDGPLVTVASNTPPAIQSGEPPDQQRREISASISATRPFGGAFFENAEVGVVTGGQSPPRPQAPTTSLGGGDCDTSKLPSDEVRAVDLQDTITVLDFDEKTAASCLQAISELPELPPLVRADPPAVGPLPLDEGLGELPACNGLPENGLRVEQASTGSNPGCIEVREAEADRPTNSRPSPVGAVTDGPLRLLQSPEDRLGDFTIKVYRGTFLSASSGRSDIPGKSAAEPTENTNARVPGDEEGSNFDPEGEVARLEWVANDKDEEGRAWITFKYQYGGKQVWDAYSPVITDEFRAQREQDMAEHLQADENAKKKEAKVAQLRAVDYQEVQALDTKQRKEAEDAAAASAAAKVAKLNKPKKGQQRSHSLTDRPPFPKIKARPITNGFKPPLPKQAKGQPTESPRGVPASLAVVSAAIPPSSPRVTPSNKAIPDILVPPTPSNRPPSIPRVTSSPTESPHKRMRPPTSTYRVHGQDSRHARKPVSTWRDDILVPETPAPPQASSSRARSRQDLSESEQPDYPADNDLPRESNVDESNDQSYQRDRRSESARPKAHKSRPGPTHTVDGRGRLQPRRISPIPDRWARHRPHQQPYSRPEKQREWDRNEGRGKDWEASERHDRFREESSREEAGYLDRRRRSDGPRAYGMPTSHDSSSRSRSHQSVDRHDERKEEKLGMIETQQRAFEIRAEERAAKRRRLEEKESRREVIRSATSSLPRDAMAHQNERNAHRHKARSRDGPAHHERQTGGEERRGKPYERVVQAGQSHRHRSPLAFDPREVEMRRKATHEAALKRHQAQISRGTGKREVIDMTFDSD